MEGDVDKIDDNVAVGNFNPLPPHGGRLLPTLHQFGHQKFQSTPSAWRETTGTPKRLSYTAISIHSLRMEGDVSDNQFRQTKRHFNPLPPHGGRLTAFDSGMVF